jgi:hypothetical protein
MDIGTLGSGANAPLEGMRVLLMLSQIKGDYALRLFRIMEMAKERWGWEINVLCRQSDRDAFIKLVAPSGKIFTYPEMLKPQGWEADSARAAEIERRLAEAEIAGRVPIGQLIAGCPASIGRAYVVPMRRRLGSAMADRVLNDNTEPFRITRRYFGFAEDMFDACQADALFAIEWGTPLHLAVWLAATRRGIPTVAMRRSKIHTDLAHWATTRHKLNTAALADAEERHKSNPPLSEFARNYLQSFRDQPRVAKVVEKKWSSTGIRWEKEGKAWLTLPYRYARAVALDIYYRLKGLDRTQRASAFERVFAPRIRALVGWRHQRYLQSFDETQLENMKYVYFPIHKETDMPLVYQATPWQDQRNTIQLIAASLPYGYKLLVREHRSNFGQRPKTYYPHLLLLPNVVLVDWNDSQFKYLRHADLIVTENGSSGWEGIMFGRKVLTVAPNFYDGAGLSERAYDVNQLSARILEVLARPATADPQEQDRKIGAMIDAEAATAFTSDAAGTERAVDLLARVIVKLRKQAVA